MSVVVRDLTKSFGTTLAVSGVSFSVNPGEVLALVGENGSGKSTILQMIAGELVPDSGTITTASVALVHQELALCEHMTVAENILLGKMGSGRYARRQAEVEVGSLLRAMDYPDLDPAETVANLPIALKQIVEIARSVWRKAEVVLFDEPTSSLTRKDVTRLFALIRQLRAEGKAIVYVSHFLDELKEISDRLLILRDGQQISEGTTDQYPNERIVREMVGRQVLDLYPKSGRKPGALRLSCQSLTGEPLPNAASFELFEGEVVGIAGLGGAGRSELLRCLMRLDEVKSGQISIGVSTPSESWKAGMGFVSEDRKAEGLALELSILDNLTLASRTSAVLDHAGRTQRTQLQIDRLGVKCRSASQRIGDLSGGNQQKVAIGRLLDAECDILLLDEPTRGIDVGSKVAIYGLIDELARSGKTVVMTSSYLPELLGVCDRIAVMSRGVLGPFEEAEHLTQESLMERCAG